MNQQKLNNSEVRAEQAASKKLQTLKLGLDVHADTIVVVRILDHSAPQPAQKFTPAKFLVWIQTQMVLAEAVHSCYEAGPFGFVLHRQLVALGVDNLVVQPVCLDEQHKGVNHDKSAARELALRLDRYVAGNNRALATVRVPTELEEQKRVQSRQREQLKRQVERVAAQGRALLLTQGHREKKGWWQKKRWEALCLQLPAWLVERLELFRRLLDAVNRELAAASAALEQAAPATRPKGLGGVSYETIEREIGDWHRFANRRQVGRPRQFETARARNRTWVGNGPIWRLGALRFLAVTARVNWCRPRKGPRTDSRRSNGNVCSKPGNRFETRPKPERKKTEDSF